MVDMFTTAGLQYETQAEQDLSSVLVTQIILRSSSSCEDDGLDDGLLPSLASP